MDPSIPSVQPRSRDLRQGRQRALGVLYAADVSGIDHPRLAFDACREHFFAHPDGTDVEPISAAASVIAEAWVKAVLDDKMSLDGTIRRSSKRWKVNRMQPIERNILRIGVFEALKVDDLPVTDTIFDCVELAKRFGASSSASFINGILDQICRDNDIL